MSWTTQQESFVNIFGTRISVMNAFLVLTDFRTPPQSVTVQRGDNDLCMLVRPKLEYVSPIWNPHTTTQIKHLENVQHCAARFVKNDHRRQTVTTDLIATLGWPTLERRRIIKQAMTFYPKNHNIINITPPTGLLKP